MNITINGDLLFWEWIEQFEDEPNLIGQFAFAVSLDDLFPRQSFQNNAEEIYAHLFKASVSDEAMRLFKQMWSRYLNELGITKRTNWKMCCEVASRILLERYYRMTDFDDAEFNRQKRVFYSSQIVFKNKRKMLH